MIKRLFHIATVAALLMGAATPAFGTGSWTILVDGNTRTQSDYIQDLTRSCLEKYPATDDTPTWEATLGQCLLNSKLFSEATVTRSETGQLRVHVEDRWTLIPIPLAQRDSEGGKALGLMLLETNFLGRGIFALGVAQQSDLGFGSVLILSDKNFRGTNHTAGVVLGHTRERLTCGTNTPLFKMAERMTVFQPSYGHQSGPTTATLSLSMRDHAFERFGEYAPLEHYQDFALRFMTVWDKSHFKLYYQEGLILRGEIALQAYRSDSLTPQRAVSISANYQMSPWRDHAIYYQGTLGWLNGGSVADTPRLGGGRGYRGFSRQTIWPSRAMTHSLDYHIPWRVTDRSTWTMAAFAETNLFEQVARPNEWERHHAEGFGIYLFLRQIAVPGLGLIGGWMDGHRPFISFSLGTSTEGR